MTRAIAPLRLLAFILCVVAASACARDAATKSTTNGVADSSSPLAASLPVDSARPLDEALHRFRADIVDTPTVFRNAAPTREALVRRFATAIERADTAALLGMVQSRAEFTYLVFPSSINTRPPYTQAPELVWMQIRLASNKGITRIVRRLAGQPFGYLDHACASTPEQEGRNRIWTRCTVRRVRAAGDTVTQQLFGAIIERDGQFKFASYGNKL